ncbi:hypothetical protein [Lacrimispora sp.]|uniref:hypothetical protein n=1 Tax=Lacrimispora sp. TaxID=2719234 RepID=UPI002FD8990E
MEKVYEKAREFIYRNARPLDLARWQYHFESGSKKAVLNVLSYFQNADGGFGHGLEADSWNPNSSPIQTWAATEILREINFTDNTHTIFQGILHYLESGKDFQGHFWYNTVKSNNDYPHAPWWHMDSGSICHNNYNPTACLAGFIIRFADKQSELYKLGCRITSDALDQLFAVQKQNDMHTLSCYIRLLEYCEETDAAGIFNLREFREKMMQQVKGSITQNLADWESSYICKPSQFFNSKDSIFYNDNKNIAEYECEYIIRTQLADGSWNIPWSWNDYPDQWAISKNWWKSNNIIVNLLYLRGLGRL